MASMWNKKEIQNKLGIDKKPQIFVELPRKPFLDIVYVFSENTKQEIKGQGIYAN